MNFIKLFLFSIFLVNLAYSKSPENFNVAELFYVGCGIRDDKAETNIKLLGPPKHKSHKKIKNRHIDAEDLVTYYKWDGVELDYYYVTSTKRNLLLSAILKRNITAEGRILVGDSYEKVTRVFGAFDKKINKNPSERLVYKATSEVVDAEVRFQFRNDKVVQIHCITDID